MSNTRHVNSFFDHEIKHVEGWLQTSETTGKHHGHWFNSKPGGSGSSICATGEGTYMLRILNSIRGWHKTPEKAAKHWIKCVTNKDYYPMD